MMARCLKFRIKVVEGLNYPYGKNKGADQLRFSHNEANIFSGHDSFTTIKEEGVLRRCGIENTEPDCL